MIETGTVLQQRYKIDKQIGQGGMGAVYVATDERFGSTVAIKETLCMDENFRKAIEREARLLNSLKHSALPRVSDHFEDDNGLFLVMEYIPGDDVASILERDQKAFSLPDVMKWADQLLDALDYLHNQGMPVIHRDIKPQNLKITPRGQMILLDFGLAKGNPTDTGHNTAAKSIFGYSRNYASLEQIQGTGTDPRSDLYSLAATLYHLMTNSAPEDALTRAMSVLSQRPDPLQPANAINPAVPQGVAGVLQKALDLNAGERPASAAEMQKMLRESDNYAYLADLTTLASIGTEAHMFAQATKLMPEETRASAAIKQTDIKTEVLPGYISDATAVRGANTGPSSSPTHLMSAAPKNRRSFAVAAGALSTLLVVAALAGGIYVVKPSVFGVVPETDNTSSEPPVTVTAANTAPDTNSDTTGVGAESSSITTDGVTISPTRTETPDRSAETTKNNKVIAAEKQKNQTRAGETNIEVNDPDIPDEGFVVTDRDETGKVTTLRINPMNRAPNMQRPQRPPNGMNPFPPNVDLSRLTPAQRQKVLEAMRNARRPRPLPPPQYQRPPN